MSVIFFCADFSTFSYLKLASDSFGGVHKQYGPKRERGRLFYPMYLDLKNANSNFEFSHILCKIGMAKFGVFCWKFFVPSSTIPENGTSVGHMVFF